MRISTSFRLTLAVLAALAASGQVREFDSSQDIGVTPQKGKVEFNAATGEYRITGGGANMWAAVDAFHFAWKKGSGDMAITADVRFAGAGVDPHRKAAVIIRQSLDPDSAYVDVALHGDGMTSLQHRPTAGALTQETRSELKGPMRIRIERRGDRFTLLAGTPAGNLRPTGPVTVALQDPVYVGLAVCSHRAELSETAIFSNVKLEALPGPRPAPQYSSKITIFDLASKKTRTLYQASELFEAPNWSRDGKHLLVNSRGKLFRIPADGKEALLEPLNVDANLRCNNDHDYSPDAKMIALSASSPTSRGSQVYIANPDGTEARLVAAAVPSYFHGWSPNGKFLAFVGERERNFDLFRVPVAGGPEERLTSHSGYDDGPDYSPDGKWIYFNSDRSGTSDVWRMPPEGSGANDALAQQVTSDGLEDWFPHPSPDGKRLLVFSFPKGTQGHNGRMPGAQLRLLPLPGARIKPAKAEVLTTFFGGQGTINVNSWSPDSKRFAYVIYDVLPEGAAR